MDRSARHPARPAASLAALLALCAGPALAQAPCPDSRAEAAAELERNADQLVGDRASWKTVAGLLEAAAALRGNCDPKAIQLLRMAARVYHQAHLPGRALNAMMEAGDLAAAHGQLHVAASAYVDAAEIAAGLEDLEAAAEGVRRAYLLTRATGWVEEDRRSVLRRLQLLPPAEGLAGR